MTNESITKLKDQSRSLREADAGTRYVKTTAKLKDEVKKTIELIDELCKDNED